MTEAMPISFNPQTEPRVLSVYDGFFSGGARILHTDVIRNLEATTPQTHSVLSLHDEVRREQTYQPMHDDTSYKRLTKAGITVKSMHRRSGPEGSSPITRADMSLLQEMIDNADVVLSLKEQPLLALIEADLQDKPLFTCLHRSDPEHQGSALRALSTMHELGKLTAAICCAQSTQLAYHEATGIPLDKLPIIPNGVDLHKFKPSTKHRAVIREKLGIPEDTPTVLFAARFDKMKNVPLFIKSMSLFAEMRPDAHFVLCGAGMTEKNSVLRQVLKDNLSNWGQARKNAHLMGIRSDMHKFFAATDIVTLTSSYGEAAPLCLLEGMACGAIPVTTDVGDSAIIVRNPDLVTTDQPDDIAAKWQMAYESRDFLSRQVLSSRPMLSNTISFDAYSKLIVGTKPEDILFDEASEVVAQ